jgi:predicted phage baseplate assembly protein
VRELFQFVDPLATDPQTNQPQVVTRIRWDAADALPFQIDQNDLQLSLNIVPVTAGETECALFVCGPDLAAFPNLAVPDLTPFDCTDAAVPLPTPGTAVEREGPHYDVPAAALAADVTPDAATPGRQARPTIFLVGLPDTDTGGLGFLGQALRSTTPEVVVHELDLATGKLGDEWLWRRSLLSANASDPVFTLEDGIWRRIVTFRHAGQDVVHQDYATGAGFSLRFGDNVFGRTPPRGTAFEVRYRLGPGTRANVPEGAISAFTVPGHPLRTMPDFVVAARNPQEVTTGVDPESAQEIKQLTPEAYQAERFFAVQPGDYGEQAEKLDFVQRAQGTPRWTGSWLSMFVAADPFGDFALSPDQKAQLTAWMDCVRQTGREVIVKDPKPLSIDLEITVCIQPFAYASQVLAMVQDALVGSGGGRNTKPFFSPDNFTFGMPLRRSALEAEIQRIPGVRFVGEMRIRKRGVRSFSLLDDLVVTVDADQVLQLANDPERPDAGTLRLIAQGGA